MLSDSPLLCDRQRHIVLLVGSVIFFIGCFVFFDRLMEHLSFETDVRSMEYRVRRNMQNQNYFFYCNLAMICFWNKVVALRKEISTIISRK